MAKDVSDMVRDSLTRAVREAAQNLGDGGGKRRSSNGPLSGMRGVAAGAGLATLAPLAGKVAKRRLSGAGAVKKPLDRVSSKLGDNVGKGVGEKVKEKVDESGGVAGVAKELLPTGRGGEDGAPGTGQGRRMPVQQAMDVAVPIETCYNQWTQFEQWPTFMHRVTRVTQEDPTSVSFATKIWSKTKEFKAKVETQRPDERIKWRVEEGITHTGVVTFHELAPRLTRVELTVDVEPGSLLEKAARGMRAIKRAMRADLHRFKAYIEMQEMETGAWRGVIEDGELVEDHDPDYDEERDYSGDGEARGAEAEPEDEEEEDEQSEKESQRERTQRFKRQAASSRGSRSSSSGNGRSGGGKRSSGRKRKAPAGRG